MQLGGERSPEVSEVPGLVLVAGDGDLVARVAQEEAVAPGVLRQPSPFRLIGHADVEGAASAECADVDRQSRLVLAAARMSREMVRGLQPELLHVALVDRLLVGVRAVRAVGRESHPVAARCCEQGDDRVARHAPEQRCVRVRDRNGDHLGDVGAAERSSLVHHEPETQRRRWSARPCRTSASPGRSAIARKRARPPPSMHSSSACSPRGRVRPLQPSGGRVGASLRPFTGTYPVRSPVGPTTRT